MTERYEKYWGWAMQGASRIETTCDTYEEACAWLVTAVLNDPRTKGVVALLTTDPPRREVLKRIPENAPSWWEQHDGFNGTKVYTLYGHLEREDGRRAGGLHGDFATEMQALAFIIGQHKPGYRPVCALIRPRMGYDGDGPPGEVIQRWNGGKGWWE